jgi:HD-like signal output (HDOD) protein
MAGKAHPTDGRPAPDSGAEAHCLRVAAIAGELALRRGFGAVAVGDVQRIALKHHHTPEARSMGRMLDRLAVDLGLNGGASETISPAPAPAADVSPGAGAEPLEDLVTLANLFDEALEGMPYFRQSFEELLVELWGLALDRIIEPESVKALRPLASGEDLARAIEALPVFPAVALQVLRELVGGDADLGQIERFASRDQVLAASLLRVANSALYHGCREVSNLAGAIARLGTEMAAQVVIGAALKPLFASAPLRDLWEHSTTTAALCAQLADRAGAPPSGEAAVLGLVHDIGRLVIYMLPSQYAAAHTRIAEASGCTVVADYLVCGRDHAALGAGLLARWNFPDAFIEAVHDHHQPERTSSPLAGVLYLAEFLTGGNEDIPSLSRLSQALTTAGIPFAECLDLAELPRRVDAVLDAA